MKIAFATDLHGSTGVLTKLISAANRFNVDLLLVGGDLSGKRLIPVVPAGRGQFAAWEPFKQKDETGKAVDVSISREIRTEALDEYLTRLEAKGYYWHVCTTEDVERLNAEGDALGSLFHDKILSRLKRWVAIVNETLSESITCIWTGGNDDEPETIDALCRTDLGRFQFGEDGPIDVYGYDIVSLGYSQKTLFETSRELTEPELFARLDLTIRGGRPAAPKILNVHVPPVACGSLDSCVSPLQPDTITYAGSEAVRWIIEKFQPVADFAGHIHEGKGHAKIGRTDIFNPGSDYNAGIMNAFIVNTSGEEVTDYVHITR